MEQLQDSQQRHFNEDEIPSDRQWGFIIGLGLLGLVFLLRRHPAVASFIALLGLAIFGAGVFKPQVLRPLNRKWMWLGHKVGSWTNPVVTGLIFIMILFPVAVVLRLFRGDFLKLEPNSSVESYWVARETMAIAPESLKRQF